MDGAVKDVISDMSSSIGESSDVQEKGLLSAQKDTARC